MKPSLKTSLFKLILVGILFYTSYGLSNHYAASLDYVQEVAFAWERNIPFWAWTIVPYWSLNLMYAAAFSFAVIHMNKPICSAPCSRPTDCDSLLCAVSAAFRVA